MLYIHVHASKKLPAWLLHKPFLVIPYIVLVKNFAIVRHCNLISVLTRIMNILVLFMIYGLHASYHRGTSVSN